MNVMIAEPNRVYSSLIKANLEKYLFFINCDVVESFAEMKEKDLNKEYDLYITSDCLVDSEKEHLEYLKDKNFILITDSESIDENAIDYIRKSDISIINYLVKLVKRLQNNRYLKVLLVESNEALRKYKKSLLEKINLNVLDTKFLKEAERLIELTPINFVIISADSKDEDIVEFVKKVRSKFDSTKLPIVIISKIDDMPKTIEALKYGANTFIQKPYLKESFIIRINNILDIFNFDLLNEELFIDSLTNTYNGFYLNILDNVSKIYPIRSVAIIKFIEYEKIKKERGYKEANKKLVEFVNGIRSVIRKNDILIRLYKDTFLLFMPNTSKKEGEIVMNKIKNLNFEFIYSLADEGETLAEVCKMAYDRLEEKLSRNVDFVY